MKNWICKQYIGRVGIEYTNRKKIIRLGVYFKYINCYNLNFGLVTKARAYKGANQKWSQGVTFHTPWSVGECEGMNPHTPKWAPILGIRLQMDSRIFKEGL
jgi:hypothetical protein